MIHVPMDFEDRQLLEDLLSERAGHKVENLHSLSAAASVPSWIWWRA